VCGVGAVGGLVAARLARAGVDVSLVARGATVQRIRDNGLVLLEGDSRQSFEVAATDEPAELGPQDLVVLAVKTTALDVAVEHIQPLLTPDTHVLPAINGIPWWFFDGLPDAPSGLRLPSLDPAGVLARSIPADNIVGSVVHLSAFCPEPGVVRHSSGNRLILGYPSRPGDARLDAVAETLRAGAFDVELSNQIQRDIWYKLWGNMTMNPLSAITGATMDRILDDPLVRAFASRCMTEAAEVGGRIGLSIAEDPEARHAVTRELGAVRTSMLQDVDAGKDVELDALVAVVREIAEAVGVPTPDIDTLLGLARLHARVRGLYPEDGPVLT
jgi:2-dehydropantoate 2-reductase